MLSGFRTETCLYKFNVQMENIIIEVFCRCFTCYSCAWVQVLHVHCIVLLSIAKWLAHTKFYKSHLPMSIWFKLCWTYVQKICQLFIGRSTWPFSDRCIAMSLQLRLLDSNDHIPAHKYCNMICMSPILIIMPDRNWKPQYSGTNTKC